MIPTLEDFQLALVAVSKNIIIPSSYDELKQSYGNLNCWKHAS
jgi:hypothetical protein